MLTIISTMKLEDEIHQQNFTSEEQRLTINLMFTHNWLLGKMEPVFKQYDLTIQQFNILRILKGQHPRYGTIPLIKERVIDKQPDISRLLDRLYKKELVERQFDPVDRRKIRFTISGKGMKLLEKMDSEVRAMDKFLNGLSKQEMKTLNQLLDKLRD